MSSHSEQFKVSLQAAGYSLTTPRLCVFTALLHTGPLSLHELAQALPGINRSSIYRTVALFEELQIVDRLQIGWKYKIELSDQFSHHHHHAICGQCGTITDLPTDVNLETNLQHLAQAHEFLMQDHQLEIRGLCANCRPA